MFYRSFASRGVQLSNVAGLVLAAGGGRRFGGPKALLRPADRPLVCAVADVLRAAGCAAVTVVLGCEAARVRAEAGLPADVSAVDDPGWRTGAGSALRAGLAALAIDPGVAAAAVLPVDQPGLTAEAVRRLLDGGAGPDALAAATYKERRGYPVLLGREHWGGVAVVATGDVAARAYLTARASQVRWVACEDVADDTELAPPPVEEPG
jgi:nicotine blue oxidoreductase